MPANVTALLQRWHQGEAAALNDLIPLIYTELRRIAKMHLRQQPGHTLQPTALVNEAWIKFFQNTGPELHDRAHFLAVMSRVMRQVLIDYARSSGAAKRWGGQRRITWDATIELPDEGFQQLQLLALHRAIEALERESPALAGIIEMHYFGGMTAEEVAAVVNRSAEAVRHDIRLARAWLRRELSG